MSLLVQIPVPLRIAAMCAAVLIAGSCAGSDYTWMDDTPLSVLRETPDSDTANRGIDTENGRSDKAGSSGRRKGSRSARPVPRPRTKPPPPPPKNAPAISQEAALPPAGKERPEAVTPDGYVDPRKLVGLDEREVMQVLGQPEHVRTKPPATVWSYKRKKCTLEVFFYLDLSTERFRVLAYEVDSVRGTTEMKKVCLGRIQSAFRAN